MDLFVKNFASDAELQNSMDQVNALAQSLMPYKVSLSNETRKNLRVVGSSRLGLVEIVNKVAMQYNNKLTKDENATELNQRVNYLRELRAYKLAAQNLYELLDDTEKALGNDIMSYVDKFSSSLRNARKFDGDLDEAMKELDDYNGRFGSIMNEEDAATGNDTGEILQ